MPPCSALNPSASRFTVCRSACLVMDQKPGPSGSGVQWTGSSARSTENIS